MLSGSTDLFLKELKRYKLRAPWLGFPEGGGGRLSKSTHHRLCLPSTQGPEQGGKIRLPAHKNTYNNILLWGLSICQVPKYSRQHSGDRHHSGQVCLLSSSPLHKEGKRDSDRLLTNQASKCLTQEKLSSDSKFFPSTTRQKGALLPSHPSPTV